MSKRAGPPLFELLRERGESAQAPAESSRGPTDEGVPWSGAGVTRAERSAATFEDEPKSTGELRISITKVYLAIAIALAFVVAAWAAGYHFGNRAGKAELDRIVGDEPVVTPLRNPAETAQPTPPQNNSGSPTRMNSGEEDPSGGQPQDQGVSVLPGTLWVLFADGVRGADPRVAGSNYLELATLPPDQAADALAFLGSKGVRAIGVPVDSRGGGANNPSRYTLYSLGLAVPSGQYRTTAAERRDHERFLATIGAEWMRERRGGSNFSQTLWRKYDP